MNKFCVVPFFLSYALIAFEESPWLDFPYEFHFRPDFKESYYTKINQGHPHKITYQNSWNEQLNLNLGVTTLSLVELQIEGEFFQTKATRFTFESIGAQVRTQCLDDIQGDIVSLTIGSSFRFVPDHALKDPYVPYHQLVNFEGNLSLGKEFDQAFEWTKRSYLFLGAGIANQSAAYLKANAYFEMHRMHHLFGTFLKSYFGFGSKKFIDLNDFHGYGNINHQSLDFGLIYRYLFDIYGSLSIECAYRLYAYAFPKNFTSVEIRYNFPFSIF